MSPADATPVEPEAVPVEPEAHVAEFYAADREREFRVSAQYHDREQVIVTFPNQALVSDHARGLGGDEKGPSPGELLLGSLAACTAVYIGRNARRKKIPIESIVVRTRFETGHEKIDGPMHSLGFLTRVEKHVEVVGDLTDEQTEMVRFFANNCAIGETLRRGVQLDEELTVIPPR
jgi:putative redox protein